MTFGIMTHHNNINTSLNLTTLLRIVNLFVRRHDIQHNNTQNNVIQHNELMTLSIKGLFTALSIHDTRHL
jgi:hypothetical protein